MSAMNGNLKNKLAFVWIMHKSVAQMKKTFAAEKSEENLVSQSLSFCQSCKNSFKILEDKIERILNARKKIQIRMTTRTMPLIAK